MTTLLNEASEEDAPLPPDTAGPPKAALDKAAEEVAKYTKIIEEKKAAGANKKKLKDDTKKLESRKRELEALQAQPATVGGIPVDADRKVDYTKDFFGQASFLTVSGQLQVRTHPHSPAPRPCLCPSPSLCPHPPLLRARSCSFQR